MSEFFPPNVWPSDAPGFRDLFLSYYEQMRLLAIQVSELFATALGLQQGFFAARAHRQTSWLASINYPERDTDAAPGELPFGAHRDRDFLTILSTTGPGLQVQTADDTWHPVPFIPGAFVVNVGSLLANWTEGRWVSPMHRVARGSPAESGAKGPRRQSLAFFFNPDEDVPLDPLPTQKPGHLPVQSETESERPPGTVGDYLRSMLDLYR